MGTIVICILAAAAIVFLVVRAIDMHRTDGVSDDR